jgi:hypothetical protein
VDISLAHPLDRSYVIRAVKAGMGWKYWIFRVGGPLIVAVSVFPTADPGDFVWVVVGLVAFFIPEVVMWATARQFKGELEAGLRLTDVGVSQEFAGATTDLEWQDFSDARETKDFLMLRRPSGPSLAVPKARLSEPELTQLRDVLRAHRLLG